MKATITARLGAWLGAAVIAGVAATTSSKAEPLEIRAAWSALPGHLAALMPHMPKEVIRNWGKSYVLKPIRMRGSGPMLTALAAGEADIVGFGYQSFINGVVKAKLDLRVVADVLSDKPPAIPTGFWVRKESGITRIEDLKGKRLAVNARGSTIDAALRNMLNKHNMKDGRDYTIVETRFPALLPALESKRVDMAILVRPFDLIAEHSGKYTRLFTQRDSLGPAQTVVMGTRAEFVAKNRAALVDFFEDDIRMRRWLYDPKNRQQAVDIVVKVSKRPAKIYKSWVFTDRDLYRSLDDTIDIGLLQKNVNDLYKLGITPGRFDVKKYVDLSLVKEAGARLKR